MDHQQQQQQQQQQLAKVERFLKLGYSHSDILRVLESLRHDAQTNDILEELIKTCRTRTPNGKSSSESPKLVARGCSPAPSPPRAGGDREPAAGFRPVVIDGSNVAMSHGDRKVFSCQGLQLAVNWFWNKGLRDITVFVPLWRKEQPRPEAPMTDQHILHELERRKILVYTPSRCVNGKRVVCYDDRYVVKLAVDSDGIIVSNDNYRDLQTENPQWKKFIEERLLMYTFVSDKFMPPDDPLGRNGPTIDDFLRKKQWTPENKLQHCPYGKKCTYGVKCKFYHPERTNQSQLSVADELRALRDRAKNFQQEAPHQPEHRSTLSTPPPPLSMEDQSHSGQFIYHRDSSSPRSHSNTSLHQNPSLDVDEAFGSMESSMSKLYIHDVAYSSDLHLHSYSSGMGSYSLGHDDFSGSFGQTPCLGGGGFYPQSGCSHHHSGGSSHPLHQPAWSSCPSLPPPHNGQHSGHYSEKRFLRQNSSRQSHSLPRDPWVQDEFPDGSRAKNPSSEQRKGVMSQLSTLFPLHMVEQVMNAYPHVSDMSELIPLIQNYRSSSFSFS